MDIETKKNNFLDLLLSSYKSNIINTRKAYQLLAGCDYEVNSEEIFIKEKVLRENGFWGDTFWEIICGDLEFSGYLKDFERYPNYNDFYNTYPNYKRLEDRYEEIDAELPPSYSFAKILKEIEGQEKLRDRRYSMLDKELDSIAKRMKLFRDEFKEEYPRKFIIDSKKIYENRNPNYLKKQMELYDDISNPNAKIEKELKKLNDNFKGKVDLENKQKNKYSETEEPIDVKKLGLKIKGNNLEKGSIKKPNFFNNTEKTIIYFLYFKFLKNEEEFFRIDRLQKGFKKIGEGTLKNRISDINKKVRGFLTGSKKTNIGCFIESKTKRGYRLNPKIM